jgi:hypothetical protein
LFSADKLEVTGMKGLLDEEVPFFVRVQAFQKATKWLKSLEQNMKNTMTTILQGCVQARMEEGKLAYILSMSVQFTKRGHRGRDRMVVGFTTTYAIGA